MSVNIANVLAENAIKSYLVASRKGGPLQQFLLADVKYYSVHKKNGFDITGFYRLTRLIKQIKPDIIHAHSTSVYWALGIKLIMPGRKIVWHDHYGLSDSLKDNDRHLLKYFSKWIDGVIVVNDVLESWCKRNLKVPGNRIVFLKNFPHLSFNEKIVIKKKTILLNLANFRPQKDQLNLLEAVSIVKKEGIDFELWLAGAYVDKTWLLAVQNRIDNLGLQNDVQILGPVENSTTILANASIGILSSNSEGLPVTLLEYGLAGLPVICTDTGQCKQVLGDGTFGIVIPPANPEILAEAIIELIGKPVKREQLATAFNKHVREEYGPEKFLTTYLNFISNILRS